MYIAHSYERETKDEDIYRKNIIPIPAPEFIVLYNGSDEFPDRGTMRLSDMYIKPGDGRHLELAVKVLNINKGRNEDIAKRSELLSSYSIFVSLVKEYAKSMNGNRDAAISKAMDDCIRRDILKDFLEKHGSEVVNMLFHEFKLEEALEVRFEEGKAEGGEDVFSLWEKGLTLEEARKKFFEKEPCAFFS